MAVTTTATTITWHCLHSRKQKTTENLQYPLLICFHQTEAALNQTQQLNPGGRQSSLLSSH